MSWPAHASVSAYLSDRITAALGSPVIVNAESTDLLDWLTKSTFQQKSVLVSYDGYSYRRTHESKPVGRVKLYSLFWHGRAMGGESVMDSIVDAIHSQNTFTVGSTTHRASVVGGRHLLLDRGFDTYQLEIEIHT